MQPKAALRQAIYEGLVYSTPSAKSLVGVDEHIVADALAELGYKLVPFEKPPAADHKHVWMIVGADEEECHTCHLTRRRPDRDTGVATGVAEAFHHKLHE